MDLFVAQPPVNHSLTLKPLDYKNNGSHATVINLLSKDFLKVLQTRINAGFTKHFLFIQTKLQLFVNTRNTSENHLQRCYFLTSFPRQGNSTFVIFYLIFTDRSIPSAIHLPPSQLLCLRGLPILPGTDLCAYLLLARRLCLQRSDTDLALYLRWFFR